MRKNICLPLALLLCLAAPVCADSVWNDGAAGDVSTSTNWADGVSPFTADGTATDAGSITIASGAPTYTALTLSGATTASISGITAITGGGNVNLQTTSTGGLTLSNLSWTLGASSVFTASGASPVLKLGSGATLNTQAKAEGFVFMGSGTNGTGAITIESGATLRTNSAQIARASTANVTMNLSGTWENIGSGRLGESGTFTVNVLDGGVFKIGGYTADQNAGKTVINIENGGTLQNSFILATRGTGTVNLKDGGTWNIGDNTVICFGANSNGKAIVNQTGGTARGSNLQFGSTDQGNGRFGGTGGYYLNGGTLSLSGTLKQYDNAAGNPNAGAKNVTGTLFLGVDSGTGTALTTGGLGKVTTMTNVLLNAQAGSLYVTNFSQREGVSLITGSASVNILDALPGTLAAGEAGLRVSNSHLTLTGTAEMKVQDVNTFIGSTAATAPAHVSLTDSAKLTFKNTATVAPEKANARFCYLNGTNGASCGQLTLSGNSTFTAEKTYFIAGSNDAANPTLVTVGGNATLEMKGAVDNNGYFSIGGKNNMDGTAAYVGHAKLILKEDGTIKTIGPQFAPVQNSTAIMEMTGGTFTTSSGGRLADQGTFTLNQSGGSFKITTSIYAADGAYGIANLNISGGTFSSTDSITLATRGKATLTISEAGNVSIPVINAAHVQGGTGQVVKIIQNGGTLTVSNRMELAQLTVKTLPTYEISDGIATIGNLSNFNVTQTGGTLTVSGTATMNLTDLNYEGGTLDVHRLVLGNGHAFNIEMSDDFLTGSGITLDELSGTGSIHLTAADDFVFNPGASYVLVNTENGGAGFDLSQIALTSDFTTEGLALVFSGNSVMLGTTNALPEPSAWLLLLAGLGLLAVRKVRKNS